MGHLLEGDIGGGPECSHLVPRCPLPVSAATEMPGLHPLAQWLLLLLPLLCILRSGTLPVSATNLCPHRVSQAGDSATSDI